MLAVDRKSNWIFFSLITATAALLHVSLLALQIPLLQTLPDWFWPLRDTPLLSGWLWGAALALAFGAWVISSSLPNVWKLCLLIAIGTTIQFSLAYAKGRGIEGIRDRMVHTGHAQFLDLAVGTPNAVELIRQYEPLALSGKLGSYAPSKPPGTLLTYIGFERLSRPTATDDSPAARIEAMRDLAALLWPTLSYLGIPLIFLLGRRVVGEEGALAAGLLYVTIPSVNLITLHTDQALYPIAALAFGCLFLRALDRPKAANALVAGCALYAASFLSFGMLALIFWMLATACWTQQGLAERCRIISFTALGFLITAMLVWLLFDYNPIVRYLNATAYHQQWKGWDGTLSTTVKAAITDSVEYATWIGLPLVMTFCYALANAISGQGGNSRFSRPMALAVAITFAAIIYLGHTKAETARLWMFMTPFLLIAAVSSIDHLSAGSRRVRQGMLYFLLAGQWLTTLAILRFQDFY